jgi:hypothetical protein
MAQWRASQGALREQRVRELRAMTDQTALAAADALLSAVFLTRPADSRRTSSGLVRQQALFREA